MNTQIFDMVRRHILESLPDNLSSLEQDYTLLGRCSKMLLPDYPIRPQIEIICVNLQSVHLLVVDLASSQVIRTLKSVGKEYDDISLWLATMGDIRNLDDYKWSIIPTSLSRKMKFYGSSFRPENVSLDYQTVLPPLDAKGDRIDALTEQKVEDHLCEHLQNIGISFKRQLRCDVGTADVVTDQAIYEVKRFLDRSTLYQAIGQLYAYRGSINPSARLVVYFAEIDEAKTEILLNVGRSAGVEIMSMQ